MTPQELAEMIRSHFSLSILIDTDSEKNVVKVTVEILGPDGEIVLEACDYPG